MKRVLVFFVSFLSLNTVQSQVGMVEKGYGKMAGMRFQENGVDEYGKGTVPGNINLTVKKEKNTNNSFFKKLFLKLYGGYGVFTPGSYSVSSSNVVYWRDANLASHDTTIKKEAKRGLGYGPELGFGIGLTQNDFLNIGLDLEYKSNRRIKNRLETVPYPENSAKAYDELEYEVVTLTPYIIFKALARPKFFIYNKIGILVTLPFKIDSSGNLTKRAISHEQPPDANIQGDYYVNPLLTYVDDYYEKYENKYQISLGLGLNVAFGMNYRISSKLRVFGEIFGNYSALSPSRNLANTFIKSSNSTIVDTTNFHKEYASKYTTSIGNKITFKKGGAVVINAQFENLGVDPDGYYEFKVDETSTARKYTINMSVLGINVGIIYRL